MYKYKDCYYDFSPLGRQSPTRVYFCPFGNEYNLMCKLNFVSDHTIQMKNALEDIAKMKDGETATIIMQQNRANKFRQEFLNFSHLYDFELLVAELPPDYENEKTWYPQSNVNIKKLSKGSYYQKYKDMLTHVILNIPENSTHAIKPISFDATRILFHFIDEIANELQLPITYYAYPYDQKMYGMFCITKKTVNDEISNKQKSFSEKDLSTMSFGSKKEFVGNISSIRARASLIGKRNNMKFSVSKKDDTIIVTRVA